MLSNIQREIHEDNRVSWNAAVIAHNSHKGDQIRFLKGGGDTLFREELELLGDTQGLRVLHLQCNCGQDSLCLARRGAQVVGVDISDQAIDFARALSVRTEIPADFQRADLYEWLETASTQELGFDLVFSSYGALRYLSSVTRWAQLIKQALNPRGSLVMIDFHPILSMFDPTGRLTSPDPGFGEPRTCPQGVRDYVARSGPALFAGDYHDGIRAFENPHPHHTFNWGIGDVTDAVLSQGFKIKALKEYSYANGQRHFDTGQVIDQRRVLPPRNLSGLPMMFGLRAEL